MNHNRVEISVGLIRINSSFVCLKRNKNPYMDAIEFPGGKKQDLETNSECLIRELKEELNIDIDKFKFISTIKHSYEDTIITIYIYYVSRFTGSIESNENRDIVFFDYKSTHKILPTHNRILNTLKIPRVLKILSSESIIDTNMEKINLYSHIRLRDVSYKDYKNGIQSILIKNNYAGQLIVDYPHNINWNDTFHGIHYKSKYIEEYIPEKKSHSYIYSASCHNHREVNLSNTKLFDFILISPVLSSYYGTTPLGWTSFSDLSHGSFMPTLALGGVCSLGNDLSESINNNGFGLAGIKLI